MTLYWNSYWNNQFGANKTRKSVASAITLNSKEIESIKNHWQGVKCEDFWFKWYKKACIIREENDCYDFSDYIWQYIPDDFYFKVICPFFQNINACDALDDKNLYDLYFHDITQPNTIIHKLNGALLDKEFKFRK